MARRTAPRHRIAVVPPLPSGIWEHIVDPMRLWDGLWYRLIAVEGYPEHARLERCVLADLSDVDARPQPRHRLAGRCCRLSDRQCLLLRGDGAALSAGAGRFRYADRPAHALGAGAFSDLALLHRGLHRVDVPHAQRGGASSARAFANGGWPGCWECWRRSPARTASFWSFRLRCSGSSRMASICAR